MAGVAHGALGVSVAENKIREVAQAGSAWRFRRQGRIRKSKMPFKVYILWSESLGKYYVGSTNDLEDRLYRHNSGQGKFTSKGLPWMLIWSGDCLNRIFAVQLENKIKKRGIKRFLFDQNINFGK